MTATLTRNRTGLPRNVFFTALPGPTRKRTDSPYCYHMTYESTEPTIPGCVMVWEVFGGRMTYQVALERESSGDLRWHCTCADHIYRGEGEEPHVCKHVRGIIRRGRGAAEPAADAPARREELAVCGGE